MSEIYLEHYGVKHRSGRYPWGSGDSPYQSERDFLDAQKLMRKQGMTEKEIATACGMSTGELRSYKAAAREAVNAELESMVTRLKEKGMSNAAIAREVGVSDAKVATLLQPSERKKAKVLDNTTNALKDAIKERGPVDVGLGVEAHLGVSREKLNTAVRLLKDEGYNLYYLKTEQLGTGKDTSVKVLAPKDMDYATLAKDPSQVRSVYAYSPDRGHTFLGIDGHPVSVDPKRVQVRWAEEGGVDRDGVIEVRRGVPDVSLGASSYAQVRIKVGDKHYLKGMAMYADDLPKGVDLRFNTNKSRKANKLEALKELKDDPDNPFGATVYPRYYIDKNGKKFKSAHNIVNEEGTWDKWSRNLAPQFLAKQSPALAKKMLGISRKNREADLDEILSLTNPVVKKKLLESYADGADAAATSMKAARLPRQATQVLLPLPGIRKDEIYAPNFKHGERLALVRFPHAGTFEIPQLTVNNKYSVGKKLIGLAKDAVGIHPSVAERLSGADFDGDSVVAIPNNSGSVKSTPALKGLQNYDPKVTYPKYPGMKVLAKSRVGTEMGIISNLITDMTVQGASPSELARAVRHSMTVIDAHKHELNYKQSAKDNGIAQLQEKYQKKGGGAATIFSRAKSDEYVPERRLARVGEGGALNKRTGDLRYVPTGATVKRKTVNKKTGEEIWVEEPKLVKVPKMSLVRDANKLTSKVNAPIERIYADHANAMKDLARKARIEASKIATSKWSPTARKAYAKEVEALRAALKNATANAPRERAAQLYAGSVVRAKRKANPDMDKDEVKRLKSQALAAARARFRANKQDTQITITQRMWEAIQAGAISHSMLADIMNYTDTDRLRELSLPRTVRGLTPAKKARAKAMLANGYSQGDVASALGVSVSLVAELT